MQHSLLRILRREFIYLWYYFELQARQIFWYWVLGIAIGHHPHCGVLLPSGYAA